MFKTKKRERDFLENGYFKLPFLEKESLIAIQSLNESTKNDVGIEGKDFYTSVWSENKAYKETVDQGLKYILEPVLFKYLKGFQSFFANFMVKLAGENSQLAPQQDGSCIDGKEYYSITFWIPLTNGR